MKPVYLMMLGAALFLGCDDGGTDSDDMGGDQDPANMLDLGPGGTGGNAGGGTGGGGGMGNAAGDGGAGGGGGMLLPDPPDPPLLDIATIMERVNLFIGTGGFGFNYAAQTPAAQVPLAGR